MKHAANPFRSLLEETCTGLGKQKERAEDGCLAHAHRGGDVAMSYADDRAHPDEGAHAYTQGLM